VIINVRNKNLLTFTNTRGLLPNARQKIMVTIQ